MIYNIAYRMSDNDVERFIEESLHEFPAQEPGEQPEPFSAEDHYNLGIAYKEMGLLNKAMEEFRFALTAQERFVDAVLLLAACCKEKNAYSEAVNYIQGALNDSRCHDEGGRMLLMCELADFYELQGRPHDAFRLYDEIVQGIGWSKYFCNLSRPGASYRQEEPEGKKNRKTKKDFQ